MFASRLHYRAAGMVRLNCSAAGMLVAVIVAGMIGGAASAYPAVVNDDVCTFISGGNTAAPNLLIGTHLRIGLYHSELSTCTYGKYPGPCEVVGVPSLYICPLATNSAPSVLTQMISF